jgi:hypothetical protein
LIGCDSRTGGRLVVPARRRRASPDFPSACERYNYWPVHAPREKPLVTRDSILITHPRRAPEDRQIEPELELLVNLLDTLFRVPGLGLRFGLDAILGLVPGFGDTLTSLASLYVLAAARRHGASRVLLARMALNIAIDYGLGIIPFVGDLFDVYWKANVKNLELLRRHIAATPAEERRARAEDRLFIFGLIAVLVALLVGSLVITYYALTGLWHLISRLMP